MNGAVFHVLSRRTIVLVVACTLLTIAGLAVLVRWMMLNVTILTIAWATPVVVFGFIVIPVCLMAVLVPLRAATIREHRQLLEFGEEARSLAALAGIQFDEITFEGRVVLMGSPKDLLFSPLTSRACVLWALEASLNRWPTGHGCARVSDSIPFGIETSSGVVRMGHLGLVVVPRIEGFARRFDGDIEGVVEEFYERTGGEARGEYALAQQVARQRMTHVRNYELIVPAGSHVRVVALVPRTPGVSAESSVGAMNAQSVSAACVKVFVGSAADIALRVDLALSEALNFRRREIALGCVMLVCGLVYVALVLLDVIN